ncbi:hypothetical protein [Embleya hyalina]|uniref:Uncharacterized protein n=1 Tax=Embleya hyalina TaxID=516124 RepID=A0A401YD66_9ACTN|nr:hypothetical protein [Embleya hyalina]GCD92537.1 hypothetical protein EHYA_00175 [Embleya hyalina]
MTWAYLAGGAGSRLGVRVYGRAGRRGVCALVALYRRRPAAADRRPLTR